MNAATSLTAELIAITADWRRNAPKALSTAERDRVADIGVLLHKIGGEELMQRAYDEAHARNPAASFVQALWDGVGGWRW